LVLTRLCGIAALLLLAGLAWFLAPLEPGVVSLQLAYTPRVFGEIVHTWSPEDLARYRAHFPFDFVLLLSYGCFGWRWVRQSGLFATPGAAAWALPLAAACDAAENLFHLWLTEAPRFGVAWAYAVSAGFAGAKWLLVLGFAGLVLAALWRTRKE
jgi:MYXO-CTERM domain-containing protein